MAVIDESVFAKGSVAVYEIAGVAAVSDVVELFGGHAGLGDCPVTVFF